MSCETSCTKTHSRLIYTECFLFFYLLSAFLIPGLWFCSMVPIQRKLKCSAWCFSKFARNCFFCTFFPQFKIASHTVGFCTPNTAYLRTIKCFLRFFTFLTATAVSSGESVENLDSYVKLLILVCRVDKSHLYEYTHVALRVSGGFQASGTSNYMSLHFV